MFNSVGQQIAKSKTSIRRAMFDPEYNETFVFQIIEFDLGKRFLHKWIHLFSVVFFSEKCLMIATAAQHDLKAFWIILPENVSAINATSNAFLLTCRESDILYLGQSVPKTRSVPGYFRKWPKMIKIERRVLLKTHGKCWPFFVFFWGAQNEVTLPWHWIKWVKKYILYKNNQKIPPSVYF